LEQKLQSAPETERPTEARPGEDPRPAGRRPFVEPEITAAVDVLEATTFFQSSTSGGFGP
jgi:hypothetical protein